MSGPGAWDRDAYLRQSNKPAAVAGRAVLGRSGHGPVGGSRLRRLGRSVQSALDLVMQFRMYSSDPVASRDAVIYTASRELERFKAQQAEDREQRQIERAQEAMGEEARMRLLARAMAEEMVMQVRRQNGTSRT